MACVVFIYGIAAPACAKQDQMKRLIFEQQQIRGKIRRPQLVLIKSDPRPSFSSMLGSKGPSAIRTLSVGNDLIEHSPYDGPFEFRNNEIRNISP